jgi:hypothetical protein
VGQLLACPAHLICGLRGLVKQGIGHVVWFVVKHGLTFGFG